MLIALNIIPILLILALAGIVLLNLVGFVRGHGDWTQAFEKLATRYGGWYSAARATRPPAATFKYHQRDVRVKCRRSRREGNAAETEFRIRWPGNLPRLEIRPAGQTPRSRSLKGAPVCLTGDEAFDRQFHLYCGPKRMAEVRQWINPSVRWQILQLHQLLAPVPVQVAIEKGWLTVRKKCYIKEPQVLDDFVRYCLELFDQLQLMLSEGIEFRDNQVTLAVDEVRCPICSSDIEGIMVICVRCKTPHCLDCWQYNLKCGMYACDETRYLTVGAGG